MVAGMKKGDMRSGPFFEQDLVLALDHFESADAAADVDAGALFFSGRHLESGFIAREAWIPAQTPSPRWRTG